MRFEYSRKMLRFHTARDYSPRNRDVLRLDDPCWMGNQIWKKTPGLKKVPQGGSQHSWLGTLTAWWSCATGHGARWGWGFADVFYHFEVKVRVLDGLYVATTWHAYTPGNWTWNLKIGTLEKEVPNLETISFRFYVKLWGCKIYQLPEFRVKDLWFCRGSNFQRWSYMQIMTIPRLPVIPPEMNGVWGMFGWGPFIPPKTKVSK